MTTSIRELLDRGPMSRFQWGVIALCFSLNVLDGFDVVVMSFTARSVASEWGLDGVEIGLLLSASLAGMAVGSVCAGPVVDRVGRRPVVLASLAVAGATMLLSSASQTSWQLAVLRVLTGVGVGGILATGNVLAAEYASARWRGLAVSLNSTGYSVGATLGGLLSASMIDGHGWRSVFFVGGIGSLLFLVIAALRIPESIDLLLIRRPHDALDRVNGLLARARLAPLDALPPAPTSVAATTGLRGLLVPGVRQTTLLLWATIFCVMAAFYFVTSWTPTLLVEAGLSPAAGIAGGTLLNIGGILGTAVLGLLTARFPLRHVLAAYLVATAVLMAVFIASTSSLALAFVLAAAIGLLANGCIAGLYVTMPGAYAPNIRGTGVGAALAVGRCGAIAAPSVAGAMLGVGASPQALFLVFGALFLAATVPSLRIRARTALADRV